MRTVVLLAICVAFVSAAALDASANGKTRQAIVNSCAFGLLLAVGFGGLVVFVLGIP